MDTFEKILLDYGSYVLICVRYVFKETEEYERCAEINKVLKKYNVSTTRIGKRKCGAGAQVVRLPCAMPKPTSTMR